MVRLLGLCCLLAVAAVAAKKAERRQGSMAASGLGAGAMATLTSLAAKYDCHVQKDNLMDTLGDIMSKNEDRKENLTLTCHASRRDLRSDKDDADAEADRRYQASVRTAIDARTADNAKTDGVLEARRVVLQSAINAAKVVVTAAGKKLKAAELNHIAAESANNETKRLVALGRGVAQSAWETSVGRIAQERNVTMKEATGDFATQTGEAKADFDSSFGACEAEKNRTSALVANDQASVARIKSLMLTLKDRGCNGQDMKKLTPLIPRPPEPTRAERIAILRQGQNGATAPTAPTPTLVVPTPATPAAPAAPFEPVLALLERGLRGGRAVPSETRKLNRLATAFHVKLMPKVDMVEARGGVDVETEDVVGYGHPMALFPDDKRPENVKEEEKEAKAARLAGPRPGDMHGKNPPAWTTGKKAAAAKEEQETTEAEAGKAANTVSLLEEGAHAHAQIEATAAARLGACMSAFAELQLHRTLHRAPDGAEDAGAVQTVKDMEDKLASTRSDAADAFTRCKDRADGLFNKRKGAFEREFRQREVAASGDAEAATDKAQLRLNKALKALAGQEEAGMKLLGDAEAGMETARVVHSGAQGKKEAHDEAFVAGMESANELAGEARSMAETRKRGLVTKAGEAQEKAKTGAQTVLDEAEVALDARCGTMARELTDERRAVALVHVHVSKLKIVGDDPTLLPKQDVPVAPTAGATTLLDDKGEEVVAKTRSCCKMCKSGKACGDSCISKDKTCTKAAGDGCACDAAEKTF